MKRILSASLLFIAASLNSASAQNSEPHPHESAAVQFIQKADKAIKEKEYNRAIAALKQAGKLVPDDMDVQYKLATTLMAADRMPEMWYTLRTAAMQNPNHPDIARGLLSYWRMFDEQGLFNCNHETMDKVISVLGGPDHMVKLPDRDRYIYGFIGIEVKHGEETIHQTMDLRGLKFEHLAPVDFVAFDLDGRGRKIGHRTTNKGTTAAEFVLPGERVQNWTELFSIQRLHGLAKQQAPVRQITEGMMASLLNTNPMRQYRIIEATDDSVLYEWKVPANGEEPPQHEVARLMRGKIDVHRVAFVVKKDQMDAEVRRQWLNLLRNVEIKPVPGKYTTPESAMAAAAKVSDEQIWKFGNHLAIAVLSHSQKHEELAKENLALSFRIARELNVVLPKPFELTDDSTTNLGRAISYINEGTLPALRDRYTDEQVATFELASRTHMLAMVCANKELSQKGMLMINKAAKRSALPESLVAALNECIEADGTPDQIRTVIRKLHADAVMYFKTHRSLSPQQGKATQSPTAEESTRMTSQTLYMNGSKLGEITASGEVWISGVKVGDITKDGEVWVGGVKEGEITSGGEVWKAGNRIGDITTDGEVWRDGNQIGSIEKNGDVWKNGSNIGNVKGGNAKNAAAVLFYGFFEGSNG